MRYLILLICVFLFSCNTWKESLVKEGDKEDAIHNAILDFSHSKKLFNQDSVFYLQIEDPLYSQKSVSESEHAHQWVPDKPYKDIIGISIIGDEENTYIEKDFENENVRIPTRFTVVQGKLFLWWDDNYPLTQEVIDVLHQFHLVESEEESMFTTDHNKKGATYYFCRNDLSRYKKEITTTAMGYNIPKLKCPK